MSKREIQVYMFLARSGVQSTSLVAKRLKMERVQAYRTFKKLLEKGFIEATLERPTRFTIVPFEALLETFINTKKSEIASFNEQKDQLLNSWHSISAPESEYPIAKFSVITGKKKIHSKMLNMIRESEKDVLLLTTRLGLIQEDIAGIFDAIVQPAQKRKVQFKILTDVEQENLRVAERLTKKFSAEKKNITFRHLNLSSSFFPRFLIKDEEQVILYAPSGDDQSLLNLEDEGLWINDRMFISVLEAFFDQMWQSAVDTVARIEELKSGIPQSETFVIKNPEVAWEKVAKVLEGAKQDVIMITSSQSLNSLLDNSPLDKYCKNDVKFRIMASIDLDNLETAQKLSPRYEIRHVPVSYLPMIIVDSKHLFMFKRSPVNALDNKLFYLADTFYTTDPSSTERVLEMLNDTWKRGTDISEVTSQVGMKLPVVEVSTGETVAALVGKMLEKGVSSVLIAENDTPIGMINEKGLLKEIVGNRINPEKTLVRELRFTPLIILDESKSMIYAIEAMRNRGFTRAVTVKNGHLVGMLTEEAALKEVGSASKPKAAGK
jgi:sugar-specific transcriptional regulator TrmB/CBS domain-containing protein